MAPFSACRKQDAEVRRYQSGLRGDHPRAVGERSLAHQTRPRSRLLAPPPGPLAPPRGSPGPAPPGPARLARLLAGLRELRGAAAADPLGASEPGRSRGSRRRHRGAARFPGPGLSASRLGHGSRRAPGPSLSSRLAARPGPARAAAAQAPLKFPPRSRGDHGPRAPRSPARPLCGAVSWPRRLAAGTAPAGPAASLRVRGTSGG